MTEEKEGRSWFTLCSVLWVQRIVVMRWPAISPKQEAHRDSVMVDSLLPSFVTSLSMCAFLLHSWATWPLTPPCFKLRSIHKLKGSRSPDVKPGHDPKVQTSGVSLYLLCVWGTLLFFSFFFTFLKRMEWLSVSTWSEQDRALTAKSVQRSVTGKSNLSELSVLVLSLCLPASLPKYPSLEEVQLILGESFSQGTEEAVIVGRVVDHEQDSSQQLIGHQQVVQVCPLVVLAAVAATPLH